MTPNTGLCLILLTYKGKVLLLQQENILDTSRNSEWHFISKTIAKDGSAEKAIIQEVLLETQITLDNITLLSSGVQNGLKHSLFHARLSDKNVNSIERGEGRILQFFGLNELGKLHLQESTKSFFQNNMDFVANLSAG